MVQPIITLYTHGTPNGHKISIALELLDIPYKSVELSWEELAAREEWFVKINPNSKIPTIVDHSNGDYPVFESGAILLYLAHHHDPDHKLWPKDDKLQFDVIQWLMFQMSGVGPYMGQAHHFSLAAPEKIEYAINRYINESKRLLTVLNLQLEGKQYIAADQLTIADVATYSYVGYVQHLGIDHSDYPNVKSWLYSLDKHPKFIKGMSVPEPSQYIATRNDPELYKKALEEANETIFGSFNTQSI
jgi:glutathione S-transferase